MSVTNKQNTRTLVHSTVVALKYSSGNMVTLDELGPLVLVWMMWVITISSYLTALPAVGDVGPKLLLTDHPPHLLH